MSEQEIVPQGAPMGRPSSYTQGMADVICERLSLGESLIKICNDEFMPSKTTVLRWLRDEKRDDFRVQYARAREDQADSLFDQMKEIADTQELGERIKTSKDGVEITREDMIAHRRLQIETRKWMAGKLKPKKYGDKLDITSDNERIGVDVTEAAAGAAALLALARERRDASKG